jgi:TM2 domain-containing membrane protein YozV
MAFCDKCGAELPEGAQFCNKCGKAINVDPNAPNVEYRPIPDSHKSRLLALLLAGIPGLFGIWGLGQMYLGNFGKGVIFLIAGLILAALVFFTLPVCSFIFLLIGAAGYLFQLLDAFLTPV